MKKIILLLIAVLSLSACSRVGGDDRIPSDYVSSEGVNSSVSAPDTPVSAKPVLPSEPEIIHVAEIRLSAYEKTLTEGDRFMPIVTMLPQNAANKAEKWETSDSAIATVNNYGNITAKSEGSCTVTVTSVDNPEVKAEFKVTVKAPEKIELTYVDGILIVNKTYPLPSNYNPGVNAEAKAALDNMFAAAKTDGLNMRVVSGFRSYNVQKTLYGNYVKRDGAANADRYSARPGHSEHQTGLAFDINDASDGFIGTPEAKWLAENAYKYGFILRYPEGKEEITGYKFEPWHYRYIGTEKSAIIFESGLTLEEYYGITSKYE